jgi:hypothetical protein
MQFYGISFMLPYKKFGGWQDVPDNQAHPAIYQTALYGYMKDIP